MLFTLFLYEIISTDKFIYISNDGDDDNDGTYEHPLNASNFARVRESINRFTTGTDNHVHLVFKEGTYLSQGWTIMGWDYDKNKVSRITIESEEGKRATIYSSEKVTNWERSPSNPNLWTTYYPNNISQLFVGDERATLCRLPKQWKYARFYGYEFFDDPSDSEYYLRHLYVQDDCIKMLEKMTAEELHASELVVHYWWYTDVQKIIEFNSEKKYVVTRILKKDETRETISTASYYFIQGALPAITEPGEYYHHPNGTLYYYARPGVDMNEVDVNVPISTENFQTFGFNDVPNLTIQNINFHFTELGIGGYNFKNFLIYNCEFRHIRTAFSILFLNEVVVEHCLIEDAARDGCGFSGNDVTIRNNIIRHVGVIPPFGFAINFWSDNNYTKIYNNDISDGTTSLIFFGDGTEYNVTTFKSVHVENNHIHHAGYGILDDLASMFFGFHPRGVVVNHNKIHDFYANNYCGNGIYPDTGTSGTTITNNLVYNLSHSGFNLNYGKMHDVSNNIMALCRAGFSFGGYRNESYTLNITRNIVYLNRDDSYPVEGPLLDDGVINIFKKNIYYKSENRDITIAGLSFEDWQKRGYDTDSLVIDPLFTDPENGDFTFRSKENANKIGFEEFNMSFGVIGDDWRQVAANYKYHDPVVRSDELPLRGSESFEDGEQCYFYRRANIGDGNDGVWVGITDEKAHSGKHSFKVQHNAENSNYNFNFPTYFRNGTAEFTMMLFVNPESSFIFDFGIGGWIFMKDGLLRTPWALGDIIGEYSSNTWFKFGFRVDVGESIKEGEKPKYTLIVDDNETEYDVSVDDFNSVNFVIITSEGKGAAYIDDIVSSTTQYVEPFFDTDYSYNGGGGDDKSKGLSPGEKAGIAIGVILGVALIVGIVVFFVFHNKNQKDTSNDSMLQQTE